MADDNKKFKTAPANWADVLADTLPVLKSTYVPVLGESYQFYNVPGFTGLVVWKHGNVAGDTLAALPVQGLVTDGAQTIPGIKTFSSIPVLPVAVPTSDNQAMSKVHVEALIGLPAGYIFGLETSPDTDTDHDVLIATGKCRDYADTTTLELETAMTKQIDATWAAGDDAGGLFSGSVAADTTYHLFIIKKVSDNSIDAGWDTDIDASNIPAGYTAYRRIRSYITNATSNILATDQVGDSFTLRARSANLATTTPATSPTALSVTVPIGIKTIAKMSGRILNTANALVDLGPTTMTGNLPTVMRTNSGGTVDAGAWDIDADTSGQILYSCDDGALSSNLVFDTWGWYDTRGRFGGK